MSHTESNHSNEYQAYLLRLWRVRQEQGAVWLASLESVGSGARRGFADLQDLYAYLGSQCQTPQEQPLSTQEETQ